MTSLKRKKGKHFQPSESTLLLDLVEDFLTIIENKKTDATSITQKKTAWIELTEKFNLRCDNGLRTTSQLKNYYDSYKRKIRKDNADDKAELYKTGGGKFVKKLDEDGERLVSLLKPQFQPDKNTFDSATEYHDKNFDEPVSTDQTEISDDNDQKIIPDHPSLSCPSPKDRSTSKESIEEDDMHESRGYSRQSSSEGLAPKPTLKNVYNKLIQFTGGKCEKIKMQTEYGAKKYDLLQIEKENKKDVGEQNTELHNLARKKLLLEIEQIKEVIKQDNELFDLRKQKIMLEIRIRENELESQLIEMQSKNEKKTYYTE